MGRAGALPYVYDGVSVSILPDLGGNGLPRDVNDAGVIVGSAWQKNGVGCTNCEPRAVMWKNGNVKILGVLAPPNVPYMSSAAYGVNSHEQVVGRSTTDSLGHDHGFIWDVVRGIRDLNDLVPAGWTIQWATGINDAGQIVAIGSFGTGGQTLALRLDPVP